MIRRQVAQEYWLITQADHAVLSGELSRYYGNKTYPTPSAEAVYRGITLHDSGWPLHDDHPGVNGKNQPLDVFESPRQVTLPVWERSVEIAMAADPYAGLLVSIHALLLSSYASSQNGPASASWDLKEPRARFEVNRFQHRMFEIQEMLRLQLGMRVDLPLTNGLASGLTDPAEARLKSDYQCLAAMDMASLALCCTRPPFDTHRELFLHFQRDGNDLLVDKWPFSSPAIEVKVPFRRVPARAYLDPADLQAAMNGAALESFTAAVRPHKL